MTCWPSWLWMMWAPKSPRSHSVSPEFQQHHITTYDHFIHVSSSEKASNTNDPFQKIKVRIISLLRTAVTLVWWSEVKKCAGRRGFLTRRVCNYRNIPGVSLLLLRYVISLLASFHLIIPYKAVDERADTLPLKQRNIWETHFIINWRRLWH